MTTRIAAAAALALLALPASATAATSYARGETTVDPGSALQAAGISVRAVAPARAADGTVVLPGSAGRLDRTPLRGVMRHRGGLRLVRGERRVALQAPRIVLERTRRVLTAEVGGRRTTVFTVDVRRSRAIDSGFAARVDRLDLRLTRRGAELLSDRLGRTLRAKLRVASIELAPRPETLAVVAGGTSLLLDPGAAQALQAAGVSVTPVGRATVDETGFRFPVTGGEVDPEGRGTIDHSGGLLFARGDQRLTIDAFSVDTTTTPALVRVGTPLGRVPAFNAEITGGGPTTPTTKLTLTAAAADALNRASGTTAFREGQDVGTTTTTYEVAGD